MKAGQKPRPQLRIRRVNLDTGRENVAVISTHSCALRPEVFRGFSRVELKTGGKSILATLLITDDEPLVGSEDLGLAEPACRRFASPSGSLVSVTPAKSPESLDAVRRKILGSVLSGIVTLTLTTRAFRRRMPPFMRPLLLAAIAPSPRRGTGGVSSGRSDDVGR